MIFYKTAESELQDATKYLRLPAAQKSYCWVKVSFRISKTTKVKLDRLAKVEDVKIYDLALCLVNFLVWRLSGRESVEVGGRADDLLKYHPDLANSPFESGGTVGAQTNFRDGGSFIESAGALKFGRLSKKYEIGFNDMSVNDVASGDLCSSPFTQSFLNISIDCSQLSALHIVFRDDLFSLEQVQVMGQQFIHLFGIVAENRAIQVQQISLVTKEHRSVLPKPTARLARRKYKSLSQMLDESFTKFSREPAISWKEQDWSYQELDAISNDLALEFKRSGASRGRVIAILGEKSFGLLAAMVAVIRSGAVLLTIDPKLPEVRKTSMLKIAKAGLLVDLTNGAPKSEIVRMPTILVNPKSGRMTGRSGKKKKWQVLKKGRNDAAYIFFTSGTTGVPKAILGSQIGLAHFLNWQKSKFKVGPGDRHSQLIGASFDVVLRDIFLPLVSGACVCLPDQIAGEALLEWLLREKITVIHTVPTLAESWLLFANDYLRLDKLKIVFFAGEPLKDTLVARWRALISRDCLIANFYGPTETTLAKFFYLVPRDPMPGIQPVGFSQPFTQGLIINQDGLLCGVGEPGEIVIRTPFMSHGYLNGTKEQNNKFIQNLFTKKKGDRCYRTGDVGRYLPDGAISFSGRKDNQIKISGQRVELGEIEVALLKSPFVEQSVVIAIGESGSYKLEAFVVPKKGKQIDPSALQDFLGNALPGHMVPASICEVTSFPLTANGKVDRGQLIKSFEESEKRSLQDVPTVAFENEFQEHLFKAWSQVLGSYNFRIDDNFFRVGGSSLTALTLGAFISKDLKIDMRACDILATPKFMDLARAIEAKIRSGTSKYIERKIQYYDSGPLSYGQQFDWTNGWGREQNIQSAWRRTSRYFELVGQLDVKVLRQAFRSLVERHHGLRIGFHLADGRLSQRLRKTPDDVLEVVDLTNLCLADSQSETAKKVREIHEERFNFLGDAILFKATLIIGAESRGILVIRSPHILVDGYSLKMILSDLGRLYRKMKSQSDKALGSEFDDRSRMTIVQLGHLQKESETTDVYQKRKLYWQTYVSQVKDTTSYGSPKEGVRDDEFVSASIELTVADSDKIADVCEALQCTRFELIFAIFSRHILRRCDRANTPIAVFHSGRISAADSEIVGNLSVTIPVFPKGRGSLEETIIENRRELTSGAQNLPFPMTEVWTAMNHVYPKIAINYAPLRQTLELDGVEVKRNVSLEDVHGPIDTIYDLILGFDERKLGFFCRKAFLSQSELNGVVSDIKGELSSLISDQTSKAA